VTLNPSRAPDPSAEEILRSVLGRDTGRLIAHLPMARTGREPEGVHQVRVATRRLRAELKVLGPALRPKPIEELRSDLRWLGRSLGPKRDLDTVTELLVVPVDRDGAVGVTLALRSSLAEARWHAEKRAGEAFAAPRLRSLVTTLAATVIDPPTSRLASLPLRGILAPGLAKQSALLREAVDTFESDPTEAQLHRVRIEAKHLRYTTELASAYAGEAADGLTESLRGMQDALGDRRDLHRGVALLESLGTQDEPFRTTSPEGQIINEMVADLRTQTESCSTQWQSHWSSAQQWLVELGGFVPS